MSIGTSSSHRKSVTANVKDDTDRDAKKTHGKSCQIRHQALDLFVQFVLLIGIEREHGECEAERVRCRLCTPIDRC